MIHRCDIAARAKKQACNGFYISGCIEPLRRKKNRAMGMLGGLRDVSGYVVCVRVVGACDDLLTWSEHRLQAAQGNTDAARQ